MDALLEGGANPALLNAGNSRGTMCGALAGAFPALACSSLLVDPNPDNHGQSISALVAYSLPLTLPFTVGLGGLLGDHLHRQFSGAPEP